MTEAQAWLEDTKMHLDDLDDVLENQIATEVLGEISETYSDPTFGTPTWVDYNTTPELVRQIIAMIYAGWIFDRAYSEVLDSSGVSYGELLRSNAESLIIGIVSTSILILELLPNLPTIGTTFYPTDSSSTTDAMLANSNPDDTSIGPGLFSIRQVF